MFDEKNVQFYVSLWLLNFCLIGCQTTNNCTVVEDYYKRTECTPGLDLQNYDYNNYYLNRKMFIMELDSKRVDETTTTSKKPGKDTFTELDKICYARNRNTTSTCCDGWMGNMCEIGCYRHDIFFINKKIIESITDASGAALYKSLISSHNNYGWTPRRDKSFDCIDIKFESSIPLLEISVRGKETNVRSFTISSVDENDMEENTTSINDYRLVFSSHLNAIKRLRFWPIEKLDLDLPYNIKLDITSCTEFTGENELEIWISNMRPRMWGSSGNNDESGAVRDSKGYGFIIWGLIAFGLFLSTVFE